jgi:HlyD family secretion protein
VKLNNKKWLLIASLVVVVVGLSAWYMLSKRDKVQYFRQPVERGDIRSVVEATGTISAVTTVQVGSQVSGTISKLYVDFNSRVKKGQLLAELDQSLFRGALLQAEADLANARANMVAAQATVAKNKATALQAHADYERTASLAKAGVMSQQQLDAAKANADTSDATVNASQAQVTQAAAQVQQKQAAVTVAQTNLNYTMIHAPVDGVVVARNIDVGQTVAASLQAPTLFIIAQDLSKMQVYTATDESDVGMIKVSQPVNFKVDAFPKDTFQGRVDQIRMNATTVQNVVTYTTVVDFDNPDQKLFPGMTAYVTIPVASALNVLKVPNGALRYKPDMPATEIRALYQKYGLAPAGDQQSAKGGGQGGGQAGQGQGGGNQQAQSGGQNGTGGSQSGQGSGQGGGQGAGQGQGGGRRQMGAGGGQPGGGTAQGGPKTDRSDIAVLWKYDEKTKQLEPVRVRTGITDHTYTEIVQVLKGNLNEKDEVIVGSANLNKPSTPGMPGATRGPGR